MILFPTTRSLHALATPEKPAAGLAVSLSERALAPVPAPAHVPAVFAEIAPAARELAQERAEFVRRVLATAAGMAASEQTSAWIVAGRDRTAFPRLCERRLIDSARSAYNNHRRWKRELGKTGRGEVNTGHWQALVDGYSVGNRGRKGAAGWWDLFLALYNLPAAPGLEQTYRDTCNTWRRGGLAGEPPKICHVKYWLGKQGDKLVALRARKGETWFRNHVVGYIARDWDGIRVGEIWVGDHRKTDCFIRCFDEAKQAWVPKRLWITAWRDAKSGHFAGWTLYPGDESPDCEEIIRCLVLAILDNGGVPPAALYVDNGKDFQAGGFLTPVTVGGTEHSIARALGIEVITAIAFNPKAKPIENSFKTLIPYYDQRMPGYCGSDRGPKFDDAWRWANGNVEKLPSVQQARELFAWALQEHEERVTTSLIQAGVATATLWQGRTALRPALTPEELHLRTLRPLRETPQIGRGPQGIAVRYAGAYYSGPELQIYARQHWGEDVMLYADVFAPPAIRGGKVVPEHVYTGQPDGRLIGRCTVHETHAAWARTEDEREALGEAMAKVRRLESEVRNDTKAMRAGFKGNSPLAVMAEWLHGQKSLPPARPHDTSDRSGVRSLADSAEPESPHQSPGALAGQTNPLTPTPAESASPVNPADVALLERVIHGGIEESAAEPAAAQVSEADLALLAALQEQEERDE